MTVGQAGPLLGVSNPKLELEARFVIARARRRVERHIRAQEDYAPVAWRVHHDHDTEVALVLPMVEALVVEHERLVFGLNSCKPRAVAPAHLAIVGLGTSGSWSLRSLVEIAQMGSGSQLAHLLEPSGPDTTEACLFAVIAIGDHVAQGGQPMRGDDPAPLLQTAINPGSLWGTLLARWGEVLHTEAVSAGTRDLEPSPRRDLFALVPTAVAAVPEVSEARGLLATRRHDTGVHHQGLFLLSGDRRGDGGRGSETKSTS